MVDHVRNLSISFKFYSQIDVFVRRYRFQLEAFVDKLKGRKPQTWVSAEDSISNMESIEKVYEKVSVH